MGKQGGKQLGWDERLQRKDVSCSGGTMWAAQGWATESVCRWLGEPGTAGEVGAGLPGHDGVPSAMEKV